MSGRLLGDQDPLGGVVRQPARPMEDRQGAVGVLAHLYGGELALGTAPIGGLRAELVLPAA